MYTIPTKKDFCPFYTWCVDLISNEKPPGLEGEKHLLVVVDAFSKWIEIGIIKSTDSWSTVV